MTKDHYAFQIKRLIGLYPNAYPKERVLMIWNDLKWITDDQFTKIIDEYISSSRYAPSVADFRYQASVIREKLVEKQKDEARKEAKQFWLNNLSDNETKCLMNTIRGRLSGSVGDKEWDEFTSVLGTMAKGK